MAEILLQEGAAPGTPSTNIVSIYAKSDGLVYSKDDAGNETALGGTANLNALTDVVIASPLDGQVLTYQTSSTLWKNLTPSTALTQDQILNRLSFRA